MTNWLFFMVAAPSIAVMGSLISKVYSLPFFMFTYPLRRICSAGPVNESEISKLPRAESKSDKYGDRNGSEPSCAWAWKLIESLLKNWPNSDEPMLRSKGTEPYPVMVPSSLTDFADSTKSLRPSYFPLLVKWPNAITSNNDSLISRSYLNCVFSGVPFKCRNPEVEPFSVKNFGIKRCINSMDRFEKLDFSEMDECPVWLCLKGMMPFACNPMEPSLVIEMSSKCSIPFL